MEVREFPTYTTRKLADGTVRRYATTRKYVVKNTVEHITDEQRAKILEYHALGLSAPKISIATGITIGRVRLAIKKANAADPNLQQ